MKTSRQEQQIGLDRVYREHFDYVYRALLHLGVHAADVADVSHDVFLVVGRKLGDFEGRSTLRTWIYGICIKTVSDYRGRAFRRREFLHSDVPEGRIEAPQEKLSQDAQLRRRLSVLLAQLEPSQRDVFVLYEIEELSMKEVAGALGCPLQTAYSRLKCARKSLQACLEDEK